MNIDLRLESSSSFVCNLPLCQVRLSHNATFPWILLIPKRDACIELTDLTEPEQHLLMAEINQTCRMMQSLFSPHKLNIATLGNVVQQMHIHVIARYTTDPAWPKPVWNTVSSDYSPFELDQLIQKINTHFNTILKY